MTRSGDVRPLDGLVAPPPRADGRVSSEPADLDEPRRALEERQARWRAERARFERRGAGPSPAAEESVASKEPGP